MKIEVSLEEEDELSVIVAQTDWPQNLGFILGEIFSETDLKQFTIKIDVSR